LALHLAGNIRQWILVSLTGVEWTRDRDAEFTARGGKSAAEVMQHLTEAVEDVKRAIDQLTEQDLARPLVIQGYPVTGLTTVYHVVEHFSFHTGQIVFLTKRLLKRDLGFYAHLSEKSVSEKMAGASLGKMAP
jgi:uncharacterized damage-inducible protein DinB